MTPHFSHFRSISMVIDGLAAKKITWVTAQRHLEKGISFASINDRLRGEVPPPAPVHSIARAIQFLRSKAEEWNLEKSRIALIDGNTGK